MKSSSSRERLEHTRSSNSFSRLLVPIDFSSVSRLALRHGFALTRKLGARLLLLHVAEPYPPLADVLPGEVANAEKYRQVQARRLLPALIGPEEAGLAIDTRVNSGDAVEEIARTVLEEDIDLVIIGTHGGGMIARTVLGSTTQELLKRHVPLLTVCHVFGSLEFKTILLATDLSDESRRSAIAVSDLAKRLGSHVVLFHAVEVGLEGGAEAAVYLGESRRREASTKLDLLKEELSPTAETEVVIAEIGIADSILRAAESRKADIIAIAVGNPDMTVDDVIRGAHTPVLCLPRDVSMSDD